jgi:hypothetical protein
LKEIKNVYGNFYNGTIRPWNGFFPNGKDAGGGSTYDLPKSHLIFNQKSDIIELSPTAREKLAQENEERTIVQLPYMA